jgi:hypothetical protein
MDFNETNYAKPNIETMVCDDDTGCNGLSDVWTQNVNGSCRYNRGCGYQ